MNNVIVEEEVNIGYIPEGCRKKTIDPTFSFVRKDPKALLTVLNLDPENESLLTRLQKFKASLADKFLNVNESEDISLGHFSRNKTMNGKFFAYVEHRNSEFETLEQECFIEK